MKLSNSVHKIDDVRGANCYLCTISDGLTIIDSGMPGNAKKILQYISSIGFQTKDVRYIILTHADIDHSGSAAELKEVTGAKVAIHKLDAPRIAGEAAIKEVKGFIGIFFGIFTSFTSFAPLKADILLEDGQTIDGLKIIHIPGHTDGSICLYKEGEALFAGDTLRTTSKKEPRLPPSFMSVSMNQLKDSLKKILPLKYGMLLVGHGPPILDNASEQVYRLVNMYQ